MEIVDLSCHVELKYYAFTPGVYVHCSGQPGHGSRFLPNTAGEKLHKVINSFLSFRNKEERRLKDNPDLSLGHVTTINLTMLDVSLLILAFCHVTQNNIGL